jgi:phosphatidylglycerophosphate synthase
MSTLYRYVGLSLFLLGMSRPASTPVAKSYGRAAARRFLLSMSTVLVAQQALVGLAVARSGGTGRGRHRHQLTLVDLMTLSRGWAAALLAGLLASGIRDRRGVAGWMGWLALLYGAILCDWLDGPIARHRGASEVGALLDREADSWLTLCTAGAAVGWGNLPLLAASAPLVRYVLMLESLRTTPYASLHTDEPKWVRPLGIVQMLLFIAALAPFRGRATSRLVRLTAPLQTPLQLCGLLVLHQRTRRP